VHFKHIQYQIHGRKYEMSSRLSYHKRYGKMNGQTHNVTQWLLNLNQDEHRTADVQTELWDAIYQELHAVASRLMHSERGCHTLQPTALVNEAYLRLVDQKQSNWQNRAHFAAIAARVMRRILVDHARSRSRQKRGGDWQRVSLNESNHHGIAPVLELITLENALLRLALMSERMVQVVELRIFGGLTMKEVAFNLGISKRTADDDWSVAKKWLTRELSGGAP
jgi:RNA polymerase sigma-70 factor (ECF subfamily)